MDGYLANILKHGGLCYGGGFPRQKSDNFGMILRLAAKRRIIHRMSPEKIRKSGGKIVIIGTSEFGEIAFDYFSRDSRYEVAGFAVERAYLRETELCGLPVVAFEDMAAHYPPGEFEVFTALTYSRLNRDRARLVAAACAAGYRCASYLSPAAFVSPNAEIGENVFVFENNVIQHRCKLEDNVILWSGNHIGHSAVVRQNSFISSHVVVSGLCDIGENCFIGVNAAIGNGVKIGRDCTIGAGARIVRDMPDNAAVQPEASPVRENISRRLWKIRE